MTKFLMLLIVVSIAGADFNYQQVLKVAKDYRGHQVIDTPLEFATLKQAISKNSKRFRVPACVLYAICETESGFRYQLKHRRVKTSTFKHGKWRQRWTRAIGLGGVIFYSNPHVLKPLHLAPSDLYTIRGNITAMAAILRYKMDRIQRRSRHHIKYASLIKKGLRAYYGGGGYANRVLRRSRRYR